MHVFRNAQWWSWSWIHLCYHCKYLSQSIQCAPCFCFFALHLSQWTIFVSSVSSLILKNFYQLLYLNYLLLVVYKVSFGNLVCGVDLSSPYGKWNHQSQWKTKNYHENLLLKFIQKTYCGTVKCCAFEDDNHNNCNLRYISFCAERMKPLVLYWLRLHLIYQIIMGQGRKLTILTRFNLYKLFKNRFI